MRELDPLLHSQLRLAVMGRRKGGAPPAGPPFDLVRPRVLDHCIVDHSDGIHQRVSSHKNTPSFSNWSMSFFRVRQSIVLTLL